MKYILLILCLCVLSYSYAQDCIKQAEEEQNVDLENSIVMAKECLQSISGKTDSDFEDRAYLYNLLGSNYRRLSQFDVAANYIDTCITLSKKCKDKSLYYWYTTYKGSLYTSQGDLDKSDSINNYVLSKVGNKKYYDVIARANYEKGVIAYRRADYEKAIEYNLNTLKYEDHIMESLVLSAYSGLAWAYLNTENYDESETYFNLLLQDAEDNNEPCNQILHTNTIGLVNSRKGDYESADSLYTKALNQLSGQNCELLLKFRILNNISVLKFKNKKFEDAIKFGHQALDVTNEMGVPIYRAYAMLSLMKSNIEIENINEVLAIRKEIRTLGPKVTSHPRISAELEDMDHKILYQTKDYKEAYEALEAFQIKTDSLTVSKNKESIEKMMLEYTNEKNEKKLLAKEVETIKVNRQKTLLGFGFGIASIIGLLSYLSFKNSEKQKQKIENLQKELHHRLKNNLTLVDVFIDTSEETIEDQKTLQALGELKNRISSIATVHELLVDENDVTQLNARDYINQLSNNVHKSFENKNVNLRVDVPANVALSSTKSFPVGLIINEFLTNSYKYAFPQGKGDIGITLKESAKEVTLNLFDNGRGIDPTISIEDLDSFGLRIMKLLSKQLNGSFNLQSDHGTKLEIKFPK